MTEAINKLKKSNNFEKKPEISTANFIEKKAKKLMTDVHYAAKCLLVVKQSLDQLHATCVITGIM